MVTHDIGLKSFAHRVVRMVDGKINKIEHIPPENRMHTIQNLKNIIRDEYNIAIENAQNNQATLGVREGNLLHFFTFVKELNKVLLNTMKIFKLKLNLIPRTINLKLVNLQIILLLSLLKVIENNKSRIINIS